MATPKPCAGEEKNLDLSHANAKSRTEQQKTNQTTILSHAKSTTEAVILPAKRDEPCTRDNTNSITNGMTTAAVREPEQVLC